MSSRRVAQMFMIIGFTGSVFLAGVMSGHYHGAWYGLKDTGSSTIVVKNADPNAVGLDPIMNEDGKVLDFSLFWQVWDLAQARHVDRPGDAQKLLYGAINGMLQFGFNDQFSAFLPPEINTVATEDLSGSFGGVGIELEKRDGELTIVAPMKGTPGEAARLMAGDVIKAVDGEMVKELTVMEAVQKIRGTIGSQVRLSIMRVTDEGTLDEFDVDVTRAVIDVKSVEYEDKGDGVFVISIHNFVGDTITEWDRIVGEILDQSPRAIILDLRNNAGGYVNAAEHIISDFVQSGISIIQDFGEGDKRTSTVSGSGRLYDLPLTVLTNYGTASAAEMVTGAIQDHQRGQVYGTRTFGKGVIQEIFNIDVPGSKEQASVRIVTDKWYTPNENWVQDVGIKPDVEIKTTISQYEAGEDPVMERAVEDSR